MRLREFLLLTAFAAASATPGFGQTEQDTESVPDFSGVWRHQSLPGFEPLASGPTSLRNLERRNGVSNYDALVGDYKNPILKSQTSATVKKFGELSLAGVTYPNPANQCWPEPLPFIYKSFGMQMLRQDGKITILYDTDHQHRVVRMNASHPAKLKPSVYGDSVGHYEGDTLVIDTVGQRTDLRYGMIDLYGTPFTEALHVVERYRLIPYKEAKEGLERDAKENMLVAGDINPEYRGKFLQVYFTVEDENVFTTPWSATITYRPGAEILQESVCSENRHQYYSNDDADVPEADKADF